MLYVFRSSLPFFQIFPPHIQPLAQGQQRLACHLCRVQPPPRLLARPAKWLHICRSHARADVHRHPLPIRRSVQEKHPGSTAQGPNCLQTTSHPTTDPALHPEAPLSSYQPPS